MIEGRGFEQEDAAQRSGDQAIAGGEVVKPRGFGRPKKTQFRRNPLAPYPRCTCRACATCLDNAKWDRIFAKFEVTQYGDSRGMFQSALRDI